MRTSSKSGAGAGDIYLSALWYFADLEFLRDQEEQVQGISTMDVSYEGDEAGDSVSIALHVRLIRCYLSFKNNNRAVC